MRELVLAQIDGFDGTMVAAIAAAAAQELPSRVLIEPVSVPLEQFRNPARQQYHSTELLGEIARRRNGRTVLAVTAVDLYIPILTFVFGEAELGGSTAIVSSWRLRQDFYGLPPDPSLLSDRLVKEALHEAGHMFGLTHCDDFACVMAPSHSVEQIDLKEAHLCPACTAMAR